MLKADPSTNVWIDNSRIPSAVYVAPELTPESWLAMLPAVVAQLDEAQHEEFVLQILRTLDKANVEMAVCVADEFPPAEYKDFF